MILRALTEVIPVRSQDVVHGSAFNTALGSGSGVAPSSRDITFQAEIDRSNPIDKIKVFVSFMLDASSTAATLNPDGYAAVLKNVLFQRNGVGAAPNGGATRGTVVVVNAPGVDILQRRIQVANLDKNTSNFLANSVSAGTQYTLCYDIDLADDQLDDPLRTHTLCPVHLDSANPTLKLSLAAQSELDINASPTLKYRLLQVEVHIIRRDMPPEQTAKVIAAGGFIETDFIAHDVTITASGPQKIVIDSPGEYEDLSLTLYTIGTGATAARGDLTDTNNRPWVLQQQGRKVREFTIAQVQSENQASMIQTGTLLYTNIARLDFVSDQIGAPDNNLGSLLNANLEANNGQQTLLLFNAVSGTTNGKVHWVGRRILSQNIGARRFGFV
jgi:hypothetical protein